MQLFSNNRFVQVDLSIYENTIKERDFANVTGFTKTVPIGTRNEIQFIADY